MMEAAYDLLRVGKNASPDEVRKAYVRLVRRYPPEHFPEKFAELRKAYQQLTLSDDFVSETYARIADSRSPLELAACLWGDRRELRCDRPFAAEELAGLAGLLDGDDTRRGLDELLESVSASNEIEWKPGGGE